MKYFLTNRDDDDMNQIRVYYHSFKGFYKRLLDKAAATGALITNSYIY